MEQNEEKSGTEKQWGTIRFSVPAQVAFSTCSVGRSLERLLPGDGLGVFELPADCLPHGEGDPEGSVPSQASSLT